MKRVKKVQKMKPKRPVAKGGKTFSNEKRPKSKTLR